MTIYYVSIFLLGREVISEKYPLSVFNKQPSNSKEITQSKLLGQHSIYSDWNFISFGPFFLHKTPVKNKNDWKINLESPWAQPQALCPSEFIFHVKRPINFKAYGFESCKLYDTCLISRPNQGLFSVLVKSIQRLWMSQGVFYRLECPKGLFYSFGCSKGLF